jgi:hypothetical protein
VLVTELCQFGDFFLLDKKIEEYLQAGNVVDLFKIVLQRLEDDFATQGMLAVHNRGMCIHSKLNSRIPKQNHAIVTESHSYFPTRTDSQASLVSSAPS